MLERSLAVFRTHHLELRRRTIKVAASIIVCTIIAYIFSQQIATIFIAPLFNASPEVHKLVYTYLPEAFLSYLKLAVIIGVFASFPVIIYQTWRFISPGLKENEKRLAITVVFWSSLLFSAGGCFAFFSVLPKMLVYFMSYAHEGLEPLPKFGKYLTFIARTILAFGLSFQIPFLMVMTGKAGLVQASYFRAKRLYFYGAILIVSFMLTAGDFMATALLAVPLFLLYESGVFLTSIFGKKKESDTDVEGVY